MTMVYWEGSISSIPTWVAQEQGIYEANGLDVELVPVTSGGASVSGVLSGAFTITDGAAADLTFPVIEKGEKLRGLISYTPNNYYVLIGSPDLDLPNSDQPYPENLRDLKGKTIGVTGLGAFTDKLLRGLLKDAGLSEQDVNIVPVGVGQTAISALQGGQVDAYTAYPPLTSVMEAEGLDYQVIMSTENFPDRYGSYLLNHMVTTQQVVDESPELVKSFCTASSESLKWMQDPANFDELKAIVNEKLPGIPDEILTKSLETWLSDIFSVDGRISSDLIEHSNEVLLAQNAVSEPISEERYVLDDSACPR